MFRKRNDEANIQTLSHSKMYEIKTSAENRLKRFGINFSKIKSFAFPRNMTKKDYNTFNL